MSWHRGRGWRSVAQKWMRWEWRERSQARGADGNCQKYLAGKSAKWSAAMQLSGSSSLDWDIDAKIFWVIPKPQRFSGGGSKIKKQFSWILCSLKHCLDCVFRGRKSVLVTLKTGSAKCLDGHNTTEFNYFYLDPCLGCRLLAYLDGELFSVSVLATAAIKTGTDSGSHKYFKVFL